MRSVAALFGSAHPTLAHRTMLRYDDNMMLSVIIPTWNGLRYLPRCLDQLLPQLPDSSEVVVVDNGSTDGSAEWLKTTHPEVRVVALRTNQGFAGGVATGLRAAHGEALLLLNNDAFVEPGCVAALLEAAAERPDVGAFGGVLTFAHRPELVASAGITFRRDGVALDLWPGRRVADLPREMQPVLGPTGALALYRRAMLDDIGLFDPGFFAYLEDVDLAWRGVLRGWRSVIVPQAVAQHVYSATGGQGSPFKQRLLGRNRVRVLFRCLPAPLLAWCAPAILAYDIMAVVYALVTRQLAMAHGRWEGLLDGPGLLRERRELQQKRTASLDELRRWIEPWEWPWHSLGHQRELDAVLESRT